MCARYAATASAAALVEEYDIEVVDDLGPAAAPRWNVAPTAQVATVLVDDGRCTLSSSRWGLIPPWVKERPINLINARVETVGEKPSFKAAIRRRRCVLPALGYYEWLSEHGRKQPYFLRPQHGTLPMAGIFEYHRIDKAWVRTVAILTTEATDECGWVHDRMPMVVPAEARSAWLDPEAQDVLEVLALLERPRLQQPCAVSTAVNKVGNDGPGLLRPLRE